MTAADLPTLNACLNATSAVLLVSGWVCIRRRKRTAHKACMLAAVTVTVAFLVSYVTYHIILRYGVTRYQGQGWIRTVYLTVLISHTILAAVNAPMVVITLSRAIRGRFEKHERIARWTLPIWLYVSVTGVVVYLMLYRPV